jgi:uncharacterized protein DUF5753
VPESEQAALISLVSRAGQRGWWDQYADLLPGGFADLVMMEAAAAEIMIYDPQLVPPLLQTAGYARAVAQAQPWYQSGEEHDLAVAANIARQEAVLNGTRKLTVIIGEAALHQQVGGPHVLGGQLAHLAALVRGSSHVGVQVVPFTSGAHVAAGAGSHSILRFDTTGSLGVVHLETLPGGIFLEEPEALASCVRVFELLRGSALTATATSQLLDGMSPPAAH